MSAVQQCSNMQEMLDDKAPNFQPAIIPKGYGVATNWEHFVLPAERPSFQNLLMTKKSSTLICDTPNCGCLSDDFNFTLKWRIEFGKKMLCLQGGQFLCPSCTKLQSLEEFLSSLSFTSGDSTSAALVSHFVRVNGAQTGSQQSDTLYFQEVYNLAYSLKVLSSSMPALNIADKNHEAMKQTTAKNFAQTLFGIEAKGGDKKRKQEEKLQEPEESSKGYDEGKKKKTPKRPLSVSISMPEKTQTKTPQAKTPMKSSRTTPAETPKSTPASTPNKSPNQKSGTPNKKRRRSDQGR